MFDKLIAVFFGLLVAFMLYTTLVYVPLSVVAKANCLEKGYPNYALTIGLKTYCRNLEVSVPLDTLEDEGSSD